MKQITLFYILLLFLSLSSVCVTDRKGDAEASKNWLETNSRFSLDRAWLEGAKSAPSFDHIKNSYEIKIQPGV